MKIWCIEDDENINNLITYALASQGFETKGFSCFGDFELQLRADTPDLVLLDIMLPDTDGITILTKLKAEYRTRDIPVIMLTAKNSEMDIVKALDLGAEDYIKKPFGILEMTSRVKAVLRRCEKNAPKTEIITAGAVSMDKISHTVTVAGSPVELTLKEYSMLEMFLSNPRKVLTRENIMDTVWGDSYVGESRTVDMHIKTLRQKLGREGDSIVTIRGVGYKFEPVTE